MDLLVLLLSALALITAAAYVHWTLPRYTKTMTQVWITRLLLIGVGIAFGMVGAGRLPAQPAQWLAFLFGFGLVHLPAAIILFIKSRRHSGKS